MTMLLQNRTISMILTVPDVKELISPLSRSVENLEDNSFSKPPSIPVYHGSIIHIEQHHDNENTSDLIVRVPNFHHLSLPTVTITTIDDQLNETGSQRIKRRAPICPILIDRAPSPNQTKSEINSRLPNPKRIAMGLRNLTRTFATMYKSKQPSNLDGITFIPVLPDVEIIREDFQTPISSKKTTKNSTSTSKFRSPKILFIKRKHFKIKRKQSPSNSIDSQTNTDDKTVENSQINISLKDYEIEQNHLTEQQPTSIAPFTPTNPDSSSSHRYCTIPGLPLDTQTDNDAEDILIPKEAIDFTHEQIDDQLYVVHPNGDTYSETYEITYQLDPEIKDQSSLQINLDPHEYQDLASAITTWIPICPPIKYERDNINLDQPTKPNKPRVKFHPDEDLSENIEQSESYSHENNQILPLDDTLISNEDYTVIIQLLKHVLQMDTCEQINELEEN